MAENQNPIETWAAEEYREGVSPGAAARQLCRSLGAHGVAPTLKRLLEDMLSTANRASFERSQLIDALRTIAEVDDDGFTSDGHERAAETAQAAIDKAYAA